MFFLKEIKLYSCNMNLYIDKKFSKNNFQKKFSKKKFSEKNHI